MKCPPGHEASGNLPAGRQALDEQQPSCSQRQQDGSTSCLTHNDAQCPGQPPGGGGGGHFRIEGDGDVPLDRV